MDHVSRGLRTSASSSVGERLELTFGAHYVLHAHCDSHIDYLEKPKIIQLFDSLLFNMTSDVVPSL